jgi:hypothetical protein
MRFFVVIEPLTPGSDPYILAEVARDEGDDRALTPASALAGARATIQSRAELERSSAGLNALDLWRRRDDHAYDADSVAMGRTSRRAGALLLRVMPVGKPLPLPRGRNGVTGRWKRAALLRALGFRVSARALVERDRVRSVERQEIADRRDERGP